MTNQKQDANAPNDAVWQVRNETRIRANPTMSRDWADRQKNRERLTSALIRAAGKDAPEPDAPVAFSWPSLRDDAA